MRTYPDAFGHLMAIRGVVDVMVDPLAKIWDYAPCKILVEEAGGRFANFSGIKASIEEGTAVVGNSKIVQQVRKFTQSTRRKLNRLTSGKTGIQAMPETNLFFRHSPAKINFASFPNRGEIYQDPREFL